MKVGITLPQFREDADTALEAAKLAEQAGLDGVFAFDHLWPIGRPDRPALHSLALLGALAVETTRVAIGSLVARVGLVPDAVLVNGLFTVDRMAGGRLIAGLGVGDRLSRAENEAFGVLFAPVPERMASLVACCRELRSAGVTTWVGGLSDRIRHVAAEEEVALNLWGVEPGVVATVAATEVTWAGQVGPDLDVGAHLRAVADAGATWAVCAPVGRPWPEAIEALGSLVL